MSMSYVLRGALNMCKVRPLAIYTRSAAMSSIASHNIYKVTQEKKSLVDVKQIQPIKLTEAVKHFSTTPSMLSSNDHDHSKLWVIERYVSIALLGVVPLGIMMPNVLFDLLMAGSIVMHMHWGIEAIVIDYIRPIIFGNFIPKLAVWSVYLLSIFTLVGLLNLIFNNCGLGNSIRLLWRI